MDKNILKMLGIYVILMAVFIWLLSILGGMIYDDLAEQGLKTELEQLWYGKNKAP